MKNKLFRTQFLFGYNRADVKNYISILEEEAEDQRKAAFECEQTSHCSRDNSENIFELREYIKILEKELILQQPLTQENSREKQQENRRDEEQGKRLEDRKENRQEIPLGEYAEEQDVFVLEEE